MVSSLRGFLIVVSLALVLSGCNTGNRLEAGYMPLVVNRQAESAKGLYYGGKGIALVDAEAAVEAVGGTAKAVDAGSLMIGVNGMSTTVGPSLSSGTAASTWIKGSVVWEGSRPFVDINTLHDVFTRSGFAVFWEFKGGKFYLDLRK